MVPCTILQIDKKSTWVTVIWLLSRHIARDLAARIRYN